MSGTICVINPNSTGAVTEAISRALEPLRLAGGPAIECLTLEEGPAGIEAEVDIERVTLPLSRLVQSHPADAFVIACFSDPGLQVCREVCPRPVLGIAECGLLTALILGERVGIVAILERSIPRHLRYVRQLGLIDRFAGDRALGLKVVELADPSRTLERLIEVARALRDRDGADVVVLGCAGMADYREPVEAALGRPVIDPTQAAVGMALSRVLLAGA
ncbi:MAG: aspartate/glutamate racemase family protein [Geminicoccaceae bacterium]|nr:aspartate/glutamate racemase family protein [Geminicoccaceae bacterium]